MNRQSIANAALALGLAALVGAVNAERLAYRNHVAAVAEDARAALQAHRATGRVPAGWTVRPVGDASGETLSIAFGAARLDPAAAAKFDPLGMARDGAFDVGVADGNGVVHGGHGTWQIHTARLGITAASLPPGTVVLLLRTGLLFFEPPPAARSIDL